MNIDVQSQMQYGDEGALRDLFLVHSLVHDEYAKAIATKRGTPTPTGGMRSNYALDEWAAVMRKEIPAGAAILADWLQLHNNLHQAEYEALGFGLSPDLSEPDFTDESQFYDWMFAHNQIHLLVGKALGVT